MRQVNVVGAQILPVISPCSNTPPKIKGSFDATIEVNGKKEQSTTYVIKDKTKDLLGKISMIRLGVLKEKQI